MLFNMCKSSPCTVGCLQVVLHKAHNKDQVAGAVNAKIQEFAGRGFRALGVAIAEVSSKAHF
jgi:hypothetical protein